MLYPVIEIFDGKIRTITSDKTIDPNTIQKYREDDYKATYSIAYREMIKGVGSKTSIVDQVKRRINHGIRNIETNEYIIDDY